jgi:hypothetical protein
VSIAVVGVAVVGLTAVVDAAALVSVTTRGRAVVDDPLEVDSADDDVTAAAVSVPPESSPPPEHAANSANVIAAFAVDLTPASLAQARRTIRAAARPSMPRYRRGDDPQRPDSGGLRRCADVGV